jgi:hypothetical protein
VNIPDDEKNYIIAETAWLIGTDQADRIAVRLGYCHAKSLARQLTRWGRPDLALQLTDTLPASVFDPRRARAVA